MKTLSQLKEEALKEFDEKIGIVPENALLQMSGKETCFVCGHPTAADKVVQDIRDFLSRHLTLIAEGMGAAVVPEEREGKKSSDYSPEDPQYAYDDGHNDCVTEVSTRITKFMS
jgi:hypothetical protein